MKDYKAMYEAKKVTVKEALSHIKSGDFIGCAGSGCLPITLLTELHTVLDSGVTDLIVHHAGPIRGRFEYLVNPKYKGQVTIEATFYNDIAREVQDAGVVSYFPQDVYNGDKHVENKIFFAAVTPPDKHGYVKTSLSFLGEGSMLEPAKTVIVEVNENLPDTYGDHAISLDQIDYIVEGTQPLIQYPEIPITETEMKIGEYVSTLVEDGSTIQLGIGGIPNACAKAFRNKRDLGVHSEMITTTMAELALEGVINGSKKSINKGIMVGGFALGNEMLYEFLCNNPSVAIKDGRYVNDPFVIMQNNKMCSINAAIQVDITGQVCSESIGPRQFSGIGGALNFAQGAHFCKGGKAIVAIKSTAKKGSISTIQPILTPGSVVSIPRTCVDYVVTEYGVACLTMKTVQQRAEALIGISHPKFRDEIRQKAVELGVTYW